MPASIPAFDGATGDPVFAAERGRSSSQKKMVKLNERVKRSQKVSTDHRSNARPARSRSVRWQQPRWRIVPLHLLRSHPFLAALLAISLIDSGPVFPRTQMMLARESLASAATEVIRPRPHSDPANCRAS